MPLPSQSARLSSASGRSNMQRTKRPPARPILVGLGAVVILGLGVWAVVRASSGTAAGVNPQTVTAKPAETKPPEVKPEKQADKLLATNEPAKPVEPAPMEIRQGKNAAPQAGSLTGQASGAPILGHPAGVDPKLPPAPSSPAPSTLTSNPPPANPAPSPAVTTPPPAAASVTVSPEAQGLVSQASQKLESGDPVAARVMYSKVLADPRLSESDRQAVRNELSTINDDLVFSPRVAKDDPFAMTYAVAGGDSLITIARKLATGPDYRLIARINKMVDQHSLHGGQKPKGPKGPFHRIVRSDCTADANACLLCGPMSTPS